MFDLSELAVEMSSRATDIIITGYIVGEHHCSVTLGTDAIAARTNIVTTCIERVETT